ncbi:poly-beta-1,6 N-acetyl-D-glucosamine export porin PgaA [Corticibacter populi]|nr:poly-beta-1,6 N-acetyl-D-glucosamine export porin PgaA [Corticibacter populi]
MLLALAGQGAVQAAPADGYEQRIQQARQGEYAAALAAFEQDARQGPLSSRQIDDWLLISSWAGRDQDVLDIHQRHGASAALSADALAAVARALRNLRQWDASARLYQALMQREPDQPDWQLGAIHALADAGKTGAAQQQLAQFGHRFPDRQADHLLAKSYLQRATHQPYAALRTADEAVRRWPRNAAAQDNHLLSLEAAGLPLPALQRLDGKPGAPLDAATQRRLQLDQAAELVRLSFTATRAEHERLGLADKALALYDALLPGWQRQMADARSSDAQLAHDIRRARVDRLGAYWNARQLPELLQEYEALRAQEPQITDYALVWVGAALLEQRQPERARDVFAALLARPGQAPEIVESAQSGLFYALIESEALDEASALAHRTLARTPPQFRLPGGTAAEPNGHWPAARRDQALGDYYSDRLASAQAGLEAMLALGAGDQNTRIALANAYRSRGWPRRAADELRIAQANDNPLHPELLRAQAGVATDLQDWRTAEALVTNLYQRFPEEDWARRAMRSWQTTRQPELRIEAGWSDSNGATAIGQGAIDYSLLVYSAPVQQDWRLFAGTAHGSGSYPEGKGHYTHWRAGLEWRHRDTHAEAELSSLRAAGHGHAGLRLMLRQQWGDHWQALASWGRNSVNTPLRALRSGISADEGQVQLQWRAHESSRWQLGLGTLRFDDGNRRTELQLAGQQRVLTGAHWQLDAELMLAQSRNSQPGGPYFAPSRDHSILPGLTARHILHRRYERAWSQELHAALGRYWQRGHGSGAIEQLRYGQRLAFDEATEIGFQTGLQWRPYDGRRERDLFFTIDLTHRF